MVAKSNRQLVVIVGPTASGKSALAIELALRLNGEIIAADSRTVYRGMNIGTAKPSVKDQERVPHHLIDISEPDKPINVVQYKKLAEEAINDIFSRQKLPILVGGTGLYINAVIYDYQFRPVNLLLRSELINLSVPELLDKAELLNITVPSEDKNPRHLIRAIEAKGAVSQNNTVRSDAIIFGTSITPEMLKQKIAQRLDHMLADGLQDEVSVLSQRYGWDIEPMRTINYQEWRPYFEGNQIRQEIITKIKQNTYAYARRQLTWFKRNKRIQWLNNREKSVELITAHLNK